MNVVPEIEMNQKVTDAELTAAIRSTRRLLKRDP